MDAHSRFRHAGRDGRALAVLAIVIALITPLPGFVLDLLIVIDILIR